MEVAKRLEGIGEYYFSQKLREIEEMNKQQKNVINLGIGSPDMPPHPDVIKVLQEECIKPNVHAYQSYKGSPVLRNAIADWYRKWYEVELNPDTEILPLIGSKEGIMHICMTYINPGDIVLVPNPGYPTYRSAAKLAGATVVEYTLKEENGWFPDFDELEKIIPGSVTGNNEPEEIYNLRGGGVALQSDDMYRQSPPIEEPDSNTLNKKQQGLPVGTDNRNKTSRVALMFINYPHMPTGKLPTKKLFVQLVAFAKRFQILLCHDNPYSFILNDSPMSLLGVEGAKEIVIELNSLSKSHNMAGWRIGMLCGIKERIEEVLRFKSNMDSGMFLPVQLAAAKALSLPADWFSKVNNEYKKRREKVFTLLDLLECEVGKDQAGMFIWARIPGKYINGYELSDELLYESNVFITPGAIFGSAGEKYLRVSLCSTEQKIDEAIERIKKRHPALT
jgi:LL-diaminopimelate aminotransferase